MRQLFSTKQNGATAASITSSLREWVTMGIVCLFAVGILLMTSGCSGGVVVDPRVQVLDGYVQQQCEDNGWTEDEISYEDNGEGDTVFIYFEPADLNSQDLIGYDDAMAQDEARELADELNSFVYILGYTTDNRLVSTVAAEPPNFDELDEDAQTDAIQQLFDVLSEYVEFARANAEEWLAEYQTNAENYYEGLDYVNIMYDEATDAYVFAYVWEEGYAPSQDDQDAATQWQYEADFISRATGYDVILLHGTSAGGMQASYAAYYADNFLYGYQPSEMAANNAE